MTAAAQQLYAALALTVDKYGHLPICGHRLRIHNLRHACDLADCDGLGDPCSKRCQTVRAALRLKVESPAAALPLDAAPASLLPLFPGWPMDVPT